LPTSLPPGLKLLLPITAPGNNSLSPGSRSATWQQEAGVATDNLAVCNICTVNVKESKITIFTSKQFSCEQFWNICFIYVYISGGGGVCKDLGIFISNFPKLSSFFLIGDQKLWNQIHQTLTNIQM